MSHAIQMKDVSHKKETFRTATAEARLSAARATLQRIRKQQLEKGDALQAAILTGTLGAKKTAELLPLCHPVRIDHIAINIQAGREHIRIQVQVKGKDRTGMEMEALTGAALAALCLYDMAKPIDPAMKIEEIFLVEKTGGKSGHWRRNTPKNRRP